MNEQSAKLKKKFKTNKLTNMSDTSASLEKLR